MTLPQTKKHHFDEPDWIKLVFLLNDTHNWLDQMSREALYQLPVNEKRKFRRKNYYLTVPALAHILEKHYFKINRHPNAAKFTLTAIDLLSYIRDAYNLPTSKVPGTTNFQRLVETDVQVGHDRSGNPVNLFTIITEPGGKIITAFPGLPNPTEMEFAEKNIENELQEEQNISED